MVGWKPYDPFSEHLNPYTLFNLFAYTSKLRYHWGLLWKNQVCLIM